MFQVYDTSNIHSINIREVYILCQWHANGRSMGEEGIVYNLHGGDQCPCALVYMLFFLSSMVHLSNYSVNYGWRFIILRNYGVPLQEIFLVIWDLRQLQNSHCRCTLHKDHFEHKWTLSRCYSRRVAQFEYGDICNWSL